MRRMLRKWRKLPGLVENTWPYVSRTLQPDIRKGQEVLDSGCLEDKGNKGDRHMVPDSSYYTESGWRDDRERAGEASSSPRPSIRWT